MSSNNSDGVITLSQSQESFFSDKGKYVLASGGVGCGKSIAGITKLFMYCMENKGVLVYAFAPTYKQVKATLIKEFMKITPKRYLYNFNNKDYEAVFKNGSEVHFRSADQEYKYKGITMGGVYMDELTEIKENIFTRIQGNLRQTGTPKQFWATTNPSSYSNWVYNTFIQAKDKTRYKVHYLRLHASPFLDDDYIKDRMSLWYTHPERYRIMVEGGWGDLDGLVYQLPRDQRKGLEKVPLGRNFAGIDFGWTNPTSVNIICPQKELVIVNGEEVEKDVFYVVDEFYGTNITVDTLTDKLKKLQDKYHIRSFYCDSGEPRMIEDLANRGIRAYPQNKMQDSVKTGIAILQNLIASKRFYCDPACYNTIKEFDSYQWDKDDKPLKMDDHAMDAIRSAIFTHLVEETMASKDIVHIMKGTG